MTQPHGGAVNQPQARYILPSFIEHSSFGMKESNPYNKLFEERIIFLGVQVDDASANDIMAQLLVLESLDPDRDITMYINSPGGSFTSLMAIYDTMQYVRADIQTVCLGQAASAAAVLLAAGTPGKRLALPNARILIHQPSLGGVIQGQFSDLEIQAAEIERMRTLMEDTLARHTGKDSAQSSARTPTATRSSPPRRPRSTGSSTRSSSTGSCRRRTRDRDRAVGGIVRRSVDYGGDTPRDTSVACGRSAGTVRGYVLPTRTNTTDAIRLYRSHRAGTSG